jgi:hypothetical protein
MKLPCFPRLQSQEAKMTDTEAFEDRLETLAWGLLALLWGFTILLNSVPFGTGLMGTGLILLGVNVVRARRGLERGRVNTFLGIMGLCWGALELARPVLHQIFRGADLDWVIFAILLVIWGGILLSRGAVIRHNIDRRAD